MIVSLNAHGAAATCARYLTHLRAQKSPASSSFLALSLGFAFPFAYQNQGPKPIAVHWDHPMNRAETKPSRLLPGGSFRAVKKPQVLQLQPPIFPTFLNLWGLISTWQIASQNDRGLGFGLGIFLFFLLWHLAIDVWAPPRLWKAPSIARNLTSMEGGTKSSNLGTGN